MNPCTTDRVCKCCGEDYSEHRPRSYAVPSTCCWCVYEAKFVVKPDEAPASPQGRWTDRKENAA